MKFRKIHRDMKASAYSLTEHTLNVCLGKVVERMSENVPFVACMDADGTILSVLPTGASEDVQNAFFTKGHYYECLKFVGKDRLESCDLFDEIVTISHCTTGGGNTYTL